jgi:hypothetical protein
MAFLTIEWYYAISTILIIRNGMIDLVVFVEVHIGVVVANEW